MTMADFEDLVERLTARLRVDPELRMDVANELRAHLEDAAEEFRQAGAGEAEAAAQAIAALGEEASLAEQLWQANRGRIRFRRAAKWAARATLVPAAIVVTVGLWLAMWLPWRFPFHYLPADRAFLLGDPLAAADAAREKAISDRWPDDPVYYDGLELEEVR